MRDQPGVCAEAAGLPVVAGPSGDDHAVRDGAADRGDVDVSTIPVVGLSLGDRETGQHRILMGKQENAAFLDGV